MVAERSASVMTQIPAHESSQERRLEVLLDRELDVVGRQLAVVLVELHAGKVHVFISFDGFHSVARPGRYAKVFGSRMMSGS